MIHLICGRSRAGKTTYCRQFERVLHLDTYGLHPKSYPRCLEKVATIDGDLIVDGIFDTAERRIALLESYNGGGKKICTWLDTPLDIIKSRFVHADKLPHPFEPPTLDEGWDEIIIIRGNDEQRINRQTED